MSRAEAVLGRTTQRRALQAALVGIAAGLVGVIASRALFGPASVPIGIAIGAAALLCGTLLSWGLPNRRPRVASRRLPRTLRLRRRVHPVGWITPVAGSIITMTAWSGVAHSSGSGWVQAVGALLGSFLLVGLVAPVVPAQLAHLACTSSPSDGRAGQPVELTFEADRPVRVRPIFPAGPEHQSGGGQRGSRSVVLEVTPARRGVLDAVVVEVGSSAPFGLLWWTREVELPLPRLVHIAPRMGASSSPFDIADDSSGEAAPRVPTSIGEPRGVRPYSPGDPRRSVHWPATSHAGMLMVRESERPTDDPVFVELVLSHDTAEAESEAERVMAGVSTWLSRCQPVVLATHEEGGRVVRPVADQVELGRRLARAEPE
ncbi:MAG: DUF58 domain-containing protein [Acidimicrobiales bacterium]